MTDLGHTKHHIPKWWPLKIFRKKKNCTNPKRYNHAKPEYWIYIIWKMIHTAVHGLYFSKNQGMMGKRIFCDAICSIHIGHILSTAWFNHRTVSESESTWSKKEKVISIKDSLVRNLYRNHNWLPNTHITRTSQQKIKRTYSISIC